MNAGKIGAATRRSGLHRDRRNPRSLASSSFASALRAGAASANAVLVPIALLRLLPVQAYSVWILCFVTSGYVVYLDLGLQGTVQAMAGRAVGDSNSELAWLIGRAAMKLVLRLSVLVVGAYATVAILLPRAIPSFAHISPTLLIELFILTVSGQLANLVSNVVACYFVAIRDFWFVTIVCVSARLSSALFVVAAAALSSNLRFIATAYAVPLILGAASLGIRLRRYKPGRSHLAQLRVSSRDLIKYSGPLMLWNVCVLALGASGTLTVARYDYAAVPAYSIALVISSGITGLDAALLAPVTSELGTRYASGSTYGHFVGKVTRLNSMLLAILTICAAALMASPYRQVFHLNVHHYVIPVIVIIFASALRITMTPLSQLFVASGSHQRVLAGPALETLGTAVPVVSIGAVYGINGVAVAYLAGAILGVAMTIFWSVPRARLEIGDAKTLLASGVMAWFAVAWLGVIATCVAALWLDYTEQLLVSAFLLITAVFLVLQALRLRHVDLPARSLS